MSNFDQRFSCPGLAAVNEHLLRETPKYGYWIERNVPWEAPYEAQFNTMDWDEDAAIAQRVVYEEEIIPDDPKMWSLYEGKKCEAACSWDHYTVKDSERVQRGFLYKTALETQSICLESHKHRLQAGRIATKRLENLRRNSLRMRDLFAKYAWRALATNYIPNPGDKGGYAELKMTDINSTQLCSPCGPPMSTLTPGMLKRFERMKAFSDARPISNFMGADLYTLMIGDELYDRLLQIDPVWSDIIKEYNPERLEWPIGGNTSERVGNWIPRLIKFPDRAVWNDATGCLEIVPAHINVDTGCGGGRERINPEWLNAPYEAVDFVDRDAIDILRMPPSGDIGAYHFDNQNYDGVPRYFIKTIRNEYHPDGSLAKVCQVPYGNEGSFYSLIVRGFLPNKVENGWRLWVQRDSTVEFAKGHFASIQGSCRMPNTVPLAYGKCCQGESDNELLLVAQHALDPAWIGQKITVVFKDRHETATLVAHVPLACEPNRYKFDFGCPIGCGCTTGGCNGTGDSPVELIGPAPVQTVDPAAGDPTCGCGVAPCTPLTCAEVLPAPVGFASALSIAAAVDAMTPAPGDIAVVNFGTVTVNGTVISNDGVLVVVGFAGHEVTCASGTGVCGVEFVPLVSEYEMCYALPLVGKLCVVDWTDGAHSLASAVPLDTSYMAVAQRLNSALAGQFFVPTATGVKYIGTGVPGDIILDDGTVIAPAACAAC